MSATLAEVKARLAHALKDSERRQHELQIDSYQSAVDELREQIIEYEELEQGKRRCFKCASLIELPQTLIKARIARGLSQKEFARGKWTAMFAKRKYSSSPLTLSLSKINN